MTWNDRRILRQTRELTKGARRLLRINRDLLDSKQLRDIESTCRELEAAREAKDVRSASSLGDRLNEIITKTFPTHRDAGTREWVEAILLAAIIAWGGVRTFFVQPFQIPTGSMQPTLYGVIAAPGGCDPDTPLLRRFSDSLIYGKWPRKRVAPVLKAVADYLAWNVFGQTSRTADCVLSGDHIFVDKISYHFRKPRRGDIVVFDTRHILEMDAASRGKFYIKRLIGIGGDVVQIRPPHVLVNGRTLDSGPTFERIYSKRNGYRGYVNVAASNGARYLKTPDEQYLVPSNQFLPLGDNSPNSQDGRFWGSFPEADLIGRALFVYWPFSGRFGGID
jgi:signal peptidase I